MLSLLSLTEKETYYETDLGCPNLYINKRKKINVRSIKYVFNPKKDIVYCLLTVNGTPQQKGFFKLHPPKVPTK